MHLLTWSTEADKPRLFPRQLHPFIKSPRHMMTLFSRSHSHVPLFGMFCDWFSNKQSWTSHQISLISHRKFSHFNHTASSIEHKLSGEKKKRSRVLFHRPTRSIGGASLLSCIITDLWSVYSEHLSERLLSSLRKGPIGPQNASVVTTDEERDTWKKMYWAKYYYNMNLIHNY